MIAKTLLLTDTSPASPSTVVGAQVMSGLRDYDEFVVDAVLIQATGGTLDVYLQRFVPELNEWRDWYHFTQLAAGSSTFRYTVNADDVSATAATPGAGTSPALAAGALACAHPGDQLRLIYVAGASTSAGAVQKVLVRARRRAQ